MIQIMLSLILSLAMMVGGAASPADLPSEAHAWTLGNVKLEVLGLPYELEPQLNLAGKLSEDGAALRFSAISNSTTLLPASVGIDSDTVSLSFGTNERVYSFSEDVLTEMTDLDADDIEMGQLMSEFYLEYASFIATVANDPDLLISFSQTVNDALMENAVGEPEDVDIELDGQTLSGQQVTIDLTAAGAIGIVDALAESDLPQIKAIYDKLLAFGNENSGTNYANFSEVLESEYPGDANESLGMPFTFISAETDDLTYDKIDMPITKDDVEMIISEEIVIRGEDLNGNYSMSVQSPLDGLKADILANIANQGPLNAPTSSQMEMTVSAKMEDDSDSVALDLHLSSKDEMDAEGLNNGNFSLNGSVTEGGNPVPFNFSVEWDERANADDSVTNSVSMKLNAMNIDMLGLSFDISSATVADFDAFENMTEMPVTLEMLNGDEEDPDTLNFMTSIMADASRAYMDAMQLYNNSGIQQLVDDFSAIFGYMEGTELSSDNGTIGIIGGSDGPTSIVTTTAH